MGILKKLLPLLVLLLALAALLFVAGWFRPERHAARTRGVYRVPTEKVWERLANVQVWPSWLEAFHTVSSRPDVDGHDAYSVGTEFGDAVLVVEHQDDSGRLTTLLDAGAFQGRWIYELKDVPAGSELTITEIGDVGNPFLRGVMMFKDPHESMRDFLTDLGRALEVEPSIEDIDVSVEQAEADATRREE